MAGCEGPSSRTGSRGDKATGRRKVPMSGRSVVFFGPMQAGLRTSETTSRLIRIELCCVRCDTGSMTFIRGGSVPGEQSLRDE